MRSSADNRNGGFDLNIEIDRVRNLSRDYVEKINKTGNFIRCEFDNPCEFTIPFNDTIRNNTFIDYHLKNTKGLNHFINKYNIGEVSIKETERAQFCCGAICKTYFVF